MHTRIFLLLSYYVKSLRVHRRGVRGMNNGCLHEVTDNMTALGGLRENLAVWRQSLILMMLMKILSVHLHLLYYDDLASLSKHIQRCQITFPRNLNLDLVDPSENCFCFVVCHFDI